MSAKTVGKWTKPGFVGKKKPLNFGINKRGASNSPLSFNIHEVNLQWEDGSWANLNLGEVQPKNATPSAEEMRMKLEENERFKVECEILVNMLTTAEMKKARNKKILADKKSNLLELLEKVEKKRLDGKY